MRSFRRYGEYDALAWFYNRHWGREYHAKLLPILEGLVIPDLSPGGKVLDLCCGTGHLTRVLHSMGFEATGLDGSPQMIRYAAENAPACRFLVSDAREFRFGPVFHAVLSTFESLNHVMDMGELKKVFMNAFSSLRGGGLFFFDLLSEEAYLSAWNGTTAYVEEDNVCIVRGGYDPPTKTARSEITMFRLERLERPEGDWRRRDLSLFQRFHPPEDVVPALEEAGFSNITVYNAATELGMEGDIGMGRLFFLGVKP